MHTLVQGGLLAKHTIYTLSLGTIFQPVRINSVPDVNCLCKTKMCYVYNQRYDISCATLYNTFKYTELERNPNVKSCIRNGPVTIFHKC